MMSNLYYNRKEANRFLEAIINAPLEVVILGYGQIYKITSSQNPNKNNMKLQWGTA